MNLINEKGVCVEVEESCCYSPDEEGFIMAALGGFSYFRGRKTDKNPTHIPFGHPSLYFRGELIRIEDKEKLKRASDDELNDYFIKELKEQEEQEEQKFTASEVREWLKMLFFTDKKGKEMDLIYDEQDGIVAFFERLEYLKSIEKQ